MNILTFDIEDWYCHDVESGNKDWGKLECRIYEGVDRILDSLDERNLKGTFFIVGWLAENHPAVIQKIANAGHQIGCHTYQHDLLTTFDKKALFEDTKKAKSLIEDVIGKEINAFRAPAFSITKDNLFAFDVLGELGFTIDCSIFPTKITIIVKLSLLCDSFSNSILVRNSYLAAKFHLPNFQSTPIIGVIPKPLCEQSNL